MKRLNVSVKEAESKRFFFIDLGSECHGRHSFRLWVSSSLVKEDEKGEYIELPLSGVEIFKGKSEKTFILKKGDYNLFYYYLESGYRGDSHFLIEESTRLYCFEVWRSPQGSLGIDSGALVLTPEERLTIRWERTGRLYGAPESGTTLLFLDGREEEIECDLEDLQNID